MNKEKMYKDIIESLTTGREGYNENGELCRVTRLEKCRVLEECKIFGVRLSAGMPMMLEIKTFSFFNPGKVPVLGEIVLEKSNGGGWICPRISLGEKIDNKLKVVYEEYKAANGEHQEFELIKNWEVLPENKNIFQPEKGD